MKIEIAATTDTVQMEHVFNTAFPYLSLEFDTEGIGMATCPGKISGDMLVNEVEAIISRVFGVSLHVLRKTGKVWVETGSTKDWTLNHQNERGKDISTAVHVSAAKEKQ